MQVTLTVTDTELQRRILEVMLDGGHAVSEAVEPVTEKLEDPVMAPWRAYPPITEIAQPIEQPEGELDSIGTPWDARIHSSGKTKYSSGAQKGQWIRRKNLEDSYFNQVMATLNPAIGASVEPVLPPLPPIEPELPPLPPLPPKPETGASIVERVLMGLKNKQIAAVQFTTFLKEHKLAGLAEISGKPDLEALATVAFKL